MQKIENMHQFEVVAEAAISEINFMSLQTLQICDES
jgi:hypothetical protein